MPSAPPFRPRPTQRFAFKLMLAMVAIVAGVSVAALLLMLWQVESSNREFVGGIFDGQKAEFIRQQDLRLQQALETWQRNFAEQKVRLIAGLNPDSVEETAHTASAMYDTLKFNFSLLRDRFPGLLYRVFQANGTMLPPKPDQEAGAVQGLDDAALAKVLAPWVLAACVDAKEKVGYVGLEAARGAQVYQLMIIPVVDTNRPPSEAVVGCMAFGVPLNLRNDLASGGTFQTGLLLDGTLYSAVLPKDLAAPVERLLGPAPGADGASELALDGVPYRVLFHPFPTSGGAAPPILVSFYSLADLAVLTTRLEWTVAGLVVLALAASVPLATYISRRLTQPILSLVGGTEAVSRGDYAVRVRVLNRDEIGRLSASFNEMAEGLQLKDKYRNVLDRVTDREVAERLLQGQLALGGELRQVSTLFCDIRAFTAQIEGRDPAEVIEMLNEHMTALTAVVHRHHGVVDKFVGDSLVAIFGAPKSYGRDARDAAACALDLVAERAQLDARTGRTIAIGVGVATGRVVAGCMGSHDRLNYTVLGDRVNLAARLCARAQPGEILIDDATRAALGEEVDVTALEPLTLKGFSQPVAVYRLQRARREVLA